MRALKHRSRALGRRVIADGTMEFSFERPPGFDFSPGQALELTLLEPAEADPRGDSHLFSIASPPDEGPLRVASRMRDTPFKRSLHSLTPGAAVELEGPFGSFGLGRDGSRPAALLAGGIGVTPFLSMVQAALRAGDPRELWLFTSNRRARDVPYLEELRALSERLPSFRHVATLTRPDGSSGGWAGERGPIGVGILRRHLPDLVVPEYLVAGPPGFVEALVEELRAFGIAPGDLKSEPFSGY